MNNKLLRSRWRLWLGFSAYLVFVFLTKVYASGPNFNDTSNLAVSSQNATFTGNFGIGTTTPVNSTAIMNGNVGIGTWSPTARLQVVGAVSATSFSGDGSGLTGISAGGWTDGGTNVYTSTTTDNVGIGTTTPISKLQIAQDNDYNTSDSTTANQFIIRGVTNANKKMMLGIDTTDNFGYITPVETGVSSYPLVLNTDNVTIGGAASTTATLTLATTNAGSIPSIVMDVGGGDTDFWMSRTDTDGQSGTDNDRFDIGKGTTPGSNVLFTIMGTGNVGVGTTAPVGGLTVMNGNVGIGTWSPNAKLYVKSESSALMVVDSVDTSNYSAFDIAKGGSAYGSLASIASDNTFYIYARNALGRLQLGAGGNPNRGDITIDPNGNVGIGTTAPIGGLAIMSGNVGIGTWSPTQRLQVIGTVNATAFVGDGSGLTGISAGGWTDGGTNVYTSTTTDNVGIGTTTPTAVLLVENAGAQASFRVNDAVADGSPFIIDAAGNVGIGTTTSSSTLVVYKAFNPEFKLDDAGLVNLILTNGSGGNEIQSNGDSGSDVADLIFKVGDAPSGNPERFRMVAATGSIGIGTSQPVNGTAIMNGNVGVGTWVPGSRLNIIGGNIGIGTTTQYRRIAAPTNGMAIEGNVGIGTWAAQNGKMIIMGGNVGIGTTSPVGRVDIKMDAGIHPISTAEGQCDLCTTEFDVVNLTSSVGSWAGIRFNFGATNNPFAAIWGVNSASSSGDITFETSIVGSLTEKMRLNSAGNLGIGTNIPVGALTVMNGNVGIGTWSPRARLEVIGTVLATSFYGDGSNLTGISAGGWTDGGTNVFTSTTTDLVAIGTTTPFSALTVKGNVGVGTTLPYQTIAAPANGMIVEGNVGIGTFAAANGKLLVMGGNVGIGTTAPRGALIVANGNVGIGTTSPTTVLEVRTDAPTLRVVDPGGGSGTVSFTSNDNVKIAGNGTEQLEFYTNGVQRMFFNSAGNVGVGTNTPVAGAAIMNGNVGIGTWSPRAKLEVIGSVLATSFYGDGSNLTGISGGSSGWTDGGTNVYTTTTTDNVGIGTTTPTAALLVQNAGTQDSFRVNDSVSDPSPFVIDSSGNVGIGTTTPVGTTELTVYGTADVFTNMMAQNVSNTANSGASMIVDSGTSGGIFVAFPANHTLFGAHFADRAGFLSDSAAIGGLDTAGLDIAATLSTADIRFYTGGTATTNERMRISSSGNVGIGTNLNSGAGIAIMNGNVGIGTWVPANRMSITGNIGIGTTASYRRIAGPNNGLIVEGNVGVGTWAPDAELEIVKLGGQAPLMVSSTGSGNGDYVIVTSGGNIGIGTTTAVGALTVLNGNVGIGTWSPVNTLQVKGSLTTGAVTLTDAATIATDASTGNLFRVTLGGNRTLGNPTNGVDGQKVVWELIQDGTGSRTITLDTKFALGSDISSITLTTTATKRDFLGAIYNSTDDKWYVVSFVKGY